jgi:hypothetical protein
MKTLLRDTDTPISARIDGKPRGIVRVVTDVTGTLTPLSDRPALSASDRCDRCGAQAYVRVVLAGGGELLFCNHHYGEHEGKLAKVAVAVDDERASLSATASTPER